MRYTETGGWFGFAVLAVIITVQATIVLSLKDSAYTANANADKVLSNSVVSARMLPTEQRADITATPRLTPPLTQKIVPDALMSQPESSAQTLKQSCDTTLNDFTVRIVVDAIDGKREIGSGVLISHTEVLTAFHVVRRPGKIRGEFADGSSVEATYISSDKSKDLALLKLAIDPGKFSQPIEIATELPNTDRDICAVGSPFGAPLRVAIGKVLTINERGDVLITAGLLKSGDSGGPLVDQAGALVGLNVGVLKRDVFVRQTKLEKGTGVAVSTEFIRKFLTENNTIRKS